MFRISQKLKWLKKVIKEFSKSNYFTLEKRVSKAHDVLLRCQNQMLAIPTTTNAELELEALHK